MISCHGAVARSVVTTRPIASPSFMAGMTTETARRAARRGAAPRGAVNREGWPCAEVGGGAPALRPPQTLAHDDQPQWSGPVKNGANDEIVALPRLERAP